MSFISSTDDCLKIETLRISRFEFHPKKFSIFSNNEKFQEGNLGDLKATLELKGHRFKFNRVLNQFWEKKAASDLWVENCMIQCTDYYEVSETVSSTVFESLFCGSQIAVTRSHIMENLYKTFSKTIIS